MTTGVSAITQKRCDFLLIKQNISIEVSAELMWMILVVRIFLNHIKNCILMHILYQSAVA